MNKTNNILLVASSGGHFSAMLRLEDYWKNRNRSWVIFPQSSSHKKLQNEKLYKAFYPTNRNLPNLIKNLFLAYAVIQKENPNVIITTGAGVGVPFIIMGKLFHKKCIFVESLTRVTNLSLSAKLCMPFLDECIVQWPSLKNRHNKKIIFLGVD